MLLAALHMSIAQTMAYIIDDSNQTVQYSPPGRWMGVTCSDCYGDTETYNPYGCNTTDNCHLKIPFIGSGITLYMTLLYTTNFTVSIDGSAPIRYLFVQPSSILYRFTAYDQQSLQFGNHNLDLMLLDANETADGAHNSNFLFDYADINDSTPSTGATLSTSATPSTGATSSTSATSSTGASTSSTSASTSSTSAMSSAGAMPSTGATLSTGATGAMSSTGATPSPDATKGVAIGTIVGGIVGGLTALVCLCYLVLLWYHRRARSTMSYSRPERNLPVTTARIPSTLHSGQLQPVRFQGTLQGTSTDGAATTSMQHRSDINPTYISSFLPHEPLAPCEPTTSARIGAVTPPLPSAPASLPPPADSSLATTILSNDQLDVLHRLAASNTPARVLATVAQSMVLGSPNINSLEPVDVAPPPPYSSTAD